MRLTFFTNSASEKWVVALLADMKLNMLCAGFFMTIKNCEKGGVVFYVQDHHIFR
jgi:hypothetical protein